MARNKAQSIKENHLELKQIKPMTENQSIFFELFQEGFNIFAAGSAGTGKTFLALWLSLKELEDSKKYKKIIIVRSAVASRDQGFLPGSLAQKQAVFESPYITMVNDLFGRGDAYGLLKAKNIIEFVTTSYIRGSTWSDCVVVIDEVQNMTIEEIGTIITRLGKNTRLIICGDGKQSDMQIGNKRRELSGFYELERTVALMNCFRTIWFGVDDIVRSGLVKAWLMARDKLEN